MTDLTIIHGRKRTKERKKTSKKPFPRSAKLTNQKHFTSIQNEVISKRIMSINPIFFLICLQEIHLIFWTFNLWTSKKLESVSDRTNSLVIAFKELKRSHILCSFSTPSWELNIQNATCGLHVKLLFLSFRISSQ